MDDNEPLGLSYNIEGLFYLLRVLTFLGVERKDEIFTWEKVEEVGEFDTCLFSSLFIFNLI